MDVQDRSESAFGMLRNTHYCHEKVPFGVVEAINGNLRAMLRRGRGYRDHEYLLLKVQRATATRRHQAA